ncbi:MAG: hypothetical protein Q9216_002292 [Gyalolechia sp. 2 TL-2023]
MLSSFYTAFLYALLCSSTQVPLGLRFDATTDLPTLTLPYATYRAASYNPIGNIYTFKNIRFAAPPTGDLRWARPAPPQKESSIQDGSYGPICKQAPIPGPQLTGPGAKLPIGQALNQYLAGIPLPSFRAADEDCLFLDLHVPAAAIKDPSLKLPVISWFYGGAYIFGAKDQFSDAVPFYDGVGLLQQSGGNVIFVSSNYRLGAYGFLAGSTMERDGLPNAGLYDQRAVLQWIQDHIHLVGGDKTKVSAWGLSAGAGSIMHHLTAFGGTQDPLFARAVVQSPGFQPKFDRKGDLEATFQNFTALAGCAGEGLACLRAASADVLDDANVKLNEGSLPGTSAVGPAADGSWVRQLAPLELAQGNFFPSVNLILSHVSNEAAAFVPLSMRDDEDFTSTVESMYSAYAKRAGITSSIFARYSETNYSTTSERFNAFMGDSTFLCNIRHLTDAYKAKTWNLRYSVLPGLHATDLLPTFYSLNLDLDGFGQSVPYPLVPGFGGFAQAYQSYLVSHARTGDPNTYRKKLGLPPTLAWPKPDSSGDRVEGVLQAGNTGFSVISDGQVRTETCDFWLGILEAVTREGGYEPPKA